MACNIALNFDDGITRFIICGPEEEGADASFRSGINISLDCRDSACGPRKCRAGSGNFDEGTYLDDALTQQEFALDYALAHQMRPLGDVVISIAASSTACRIKSQEIATQIVTVERLSASSIAVTLETSSTLAFLPGQYANITGPGAKALWSYSSSATPGSRAPSGVALRKAA